MTDDGIYITKSEDAGMKSYRELTDLSFDRESCGELWPTDEKICDQNER